MEEVLGRLLRSHVRGLGLLTREKELARLGEESTEDRSGEGEAGADKVEAAPGVLGVRDDGEVDDCGEEVAGGVTLLEDTREETSSLGRDVLEGPDRSRGVSWLPLHTIRCATGIGY